MAELKTKLNDASVEAFLNTIEDDQKTQGLFPDPQDHEAVHKSRAEDVGF